MDQSNEHTSKILSDTDLIKSFQKDGSLHTLGTLFNRHIELVYGVCLKYFKHAEDSQDATMEIYELLIRKLPKQKIDNFKPWLYRVVQNYCLDALRKKKSIAIKENEYQLMQFQQFERHVDEDDFDNKELTYQLMEDCLETLKDEQRQSVDLFYLQKKTYKEIAEIMNISWSNTRSYIQNGRRSLKNCMEAKL